MNSQGSWRLLTFRLDQLMIPRPPYRAVLPPLPDPSGSLSCEAASWAVTVMAVADVGINVRRLQP